MVLSVSELASAGQAHLVRDEATGLDAIIVLHSTVLGPAAGGCRFWSYDSADAMAADAFRLAEGMTYKNALAGLPLGGGKSVLRRPEGKFDRHGLFKAFGAAVEELKGAYVTAEDVGTSVEDMRAVAEATRHVAGLPPQNDRPGGDPSPWTARGTFLSMQVAVERHLGRSLKDVTVAVQGVGHVGEALAMMLHAAGAKLVVADVAGASVSRVVAATNARAVPVDEILSVEADVFAPCALGAILSEETIGSLKAKVVCGAANNQLATAEDGARLADKGVLYAPDYVVNGGGIINVAAEYLGWTSADASARVEATGERLGRVLDVAAKEGLPINLAADLLARRIIAGGPALDRDAA
jgi:leucine dehydrogenase